MNYLDAILEDLWSRMPAGYLPIGEQADYWESVGFWLTHISDGSRYHWWVIRFTETIHLRWGLHRQFAAACVEHACQQAMKKGSVPS